RMFIMSNTKEFSASYKGGAGIVADDGSAGLVASMGEVFLPSGYAREDGFALVDRNASDTLFQVSKHRITGDITAKFAGFNFNATEFQSTNNTGFKTSGIYMDSAAEQFSLGDNIWFENGKGHLDNLDIDGQLYMGTYGRINMDYSAYISSTQLSIPLNTTNNEAYPIVFGVSGASGVTSGSITGRLNSDNDPVVRVQSFKKSGS